MSLLNGTCTFSTNSTLLFYSDYEKAVLEANQDIFTFSFFVIEPAAEAITRCGAYSMIGGLGSTTSRTVLSREYPSMNPHVSVKIRFNLFKIDRTEVSGKIRVTIDGTDMLYVTVPFAGTSN
jgi:hypothetical protein